ncbi:unnamed protein product [Euphydryas editha]|uniref:Uncharacterized protein n=1 Tax=Euphydryas editha TaxID=104508 RepID=A0AAU9TG64_EUPED|nr:unnamed protein product [Euphydryas editha]
METPANLSCSGQLVVEGDRALADVRDVGVEEGDGVVIRAGQVFAHAPAVHQANVEGRGFPLVQEAETEILQDPVQFFAAAICHGALPPDAFGIGVAPNNNAPSSRLALHPAQVC